MRLVPRAAAQDCRHRTDKMTQHVTSQSGTLSLLLLLVLTLQNGDALGSSATRERRHLTWADWSANEQNYHLHLQSSKDEEYYREGIEFQLFTRENPDEPELVDIYDFKRPTLKHFDHARPTKVVVHGWMSNGAGALALKTAFIHTADVNVILVDWTNIDTFYYPSARKQVSEIGQRVAYLLDFLRLVYTIPLSSIHLIGHSLGAHISGYAGNAVQWGRIGRITGLDPAGPLVSMDDTVNRLDASDGLFVDVIHTCGNLLGLEDSIGHVDFFPNGGICIQPGCTLTDMTHGTCSHNRAYDFMEESIYKQDSFKGYPCSGLKGTPNMDDPENYILMGLGVPTNATGTYCLKTRSESPFSLDSGDGKRQPKIDFKLNNVSDERIVSKRVIRAGPEEGEEGEDKQRGKSMDLPLFLRTIYYNFMHQGDRIRTATPDDD